MHDHGQNKSPEATDIRTEITDTHRMNKTKSLTHDM